MSGTDGDRSVFRRRLGRNLASFRKAHDESQEDAASALGVNIETYGRWELGEREPKAYELHRIMVRYDLEPEWLLNPTDSVAELDARAAALRRASSAAAQIDVADELARQVGVGRSAQPGRARA